MISEPPARRSRAPSREADENPATYAALEDIMAAVGTSPLSAGPPPGQAARWRRRFPGDERELQAMRRWLESVLPLCPARDDVTSVATELAANAVRHTASGRGGWFAVEVAWRPGLVRVAVADHGAPGGPRVTDEPDGESGRGLLMVRGLSLQSGVSGDERGRIVWADIAWDGPPPDPPPLPVVDTGDGAEALARRFGVPVWAGRFTGQWWALAGDELVSAPSAPELAGLLARLLTPSAANRQRQSEH